MGAGVSLLTIPVVVLTTSTADEDILQTYALGASGFVTKPVSLSVFILAEKTIGQYWFELVELPSG